MSAFVAARPRYTLPFAGKDYELLGTFGMIEAVEYATKAHIGVAAVQIVNGMPVNELAKVISAILTSCGHKTGADEAGQLLLDVVGLEGEDNQVLRFHLYAFLSICLAPPAAREKKAHQMGELIGKLTGASRGKTTGASASAPSACSPPSSGAPTPGR